MLQKVFEQKKKMIGFHGFCRFFLGDFPFLRVANFFFYSMFFLFLICYLL